MNNLDVWYSRVDAQAVKELIARALPPAEAQRIDREFDKDIRRAEHRTNLETLPKLTELVDGKRRIIDMPPIVNHMPEDDELFAHAVFHSYRATLSPDRQALIDRYTPVDAVRKVVGVGSVGHAVLHDAPARRQR